MTYELKLCEPGRRDWFNLFIFSEDAKGIQVLGAAHLELDNILAPLDFHIMGNFLLVVRRKSLISWIWFGCSQICFTNH